MDVKEPLLPPPPASLEDSEAEAKMRQKQKNRLHIAILGILFAVFWLARAWTCDHEHNETATKVPLDVHIM